MAALLKICVMYGIVLVPSMTTNLASQEDGKSGSFCGNTALLF